MKHLAIVLLIAAGIILIRNSSEFPEWGDPGSPPSINVSPYYISQTIDDTSVPNIVTAVLGDYRGFDTMFETAVIFTAGLACFFLLRIFQDEGPEVKHYRHIPTGITLRIEKGGILPESSRDFERIDILWTPYDLIIKTTCRLIIPFIQIFGLYVIAHGHHSPGGGFQGGVIIGASVIVYAVSHNLRGAINRFRERDAAIFGGIGVLIFAGTGALCLLMGGDFLNYGYLSEILHVDKVTARSHGILFVEIGVGLAVMTVMVWIYYNLSSAGKQDEGL